MSKIRSSDTSYRPGSNHPLRSPSKSIRRSCHKVTSRSSSVSSLNSVMPWCSYRLDGQSKHEKKYSLPNSRKSDHRNNYAIAHSKSTSPSYSHYEANGTRHSFRSPQHYPSVDRRNRLNVNRRYVRTDGKYYSSRGRSRTPREHSTASPSTQPTSLRPTNDGSRSPSESNFSRSPCSPDVSRRHRRHRHHHHHHRRKSHRKSSPLPYNARPLSKEDASTHRAVLAKYLDIQKNLNIDDLPEWELKGRWKRFVYKWNRGILARSWYEPEYIVQLQCNSKSALANALVNEHPRKAGATLPTLEELVSRDEKLASEELIKLERNLDNQKLMRRAERKQQKEQLEELVPKSDVGSFQRRIEKQRVNRDVQREFTSRRSPGQMDFCDDELLGCTDELDAKAAAIAAAENDSFERNSGYRRPSSQRLQASLTTPGPNVASCSQAGAAAAAQRLKSDREIRREEILRARAAEWERRMAARRQKEDETMAMLKSLARERFGDGTRGSTQTSRDNVGRDGPGVDGGFYARDFTSPPPAMLSYNDDKQLTESQSKLTMEASSPSTLN